MPPKTRIRQRAFPEVDDKPNEGNKVAGSSNFKGFPRVLYVSFDAVKINFLPFSSVKIHHQQKSPRSPKIGVRRPSASLETVIFLLPVAVFRGIAND